MACQCEQFACDEVDRMLRDDRRGPQSMQINSKPLAGSFIAHMHSVQMC